ncbi:phospholipase A2 family protein [Striga asiatica]|uniref:Phospholipase A2 family protein n=1 Tax=Striga asiatica TaxID=4170 RepID=A0A5A7Q6Z4_STRAF|nr:phospholipase A2 family protein [Striga asiatica]
MNLQVHRYIRWFGVHPNKDVTSPAMSSSTLVEAPTTNNATIDGKIENNWWSLFSFIPWVMSAGYNIRLPKTVNKELKKRSQPCTQYSAIRFRPYVSKVPWHTGPRGFLSQLFPRYGHYCGPNWSSGKDSGSLVWDKRPIDWLDFCCYCHDIGYDTHDQAELLKADMAFLECLERPHMSTRGDPQVASLYKFMCISGLRNILIPYRQNLVKLRSGEPLIPFAWLNNLKLNDFLPRVKRFSGNESGSD